MAINEQILCALASHPQGLTIHGLFNAAKSKYGNEIKDIAILSRNIYPLRVTKGFVEYEGDGSGRVYRITKKGKAHLNNEGYDFSKLAAPKPESLNGSAKPIPNSPPKDPSGIHDDSPTITIDGGSTGSPRTDSLSPPNKRLENKPSVIFSMDDLRQVLNGYALHPCIRNKSKKIILLQTLADLCMDTGTGVLLSDIKADLEAMGGMD